MTGQHGWAASGCRNFILGAAIFLTFALSVSARQDAPPAAPPSSATQSPQQSLPDQPIQHLQGSITGTIADKTGAAIAGAHVKLTRAGQIAPQETISDAGGQFTFANEDPGPFQLAISATGFATQSLSGTVRAGETCVIEQIALAVATEMTEVQVVLPRVEVAEVEIKEEEKQRVFGVIPNFYVSYLPDAAPLTTKQKFELAWRSAVDPMTFVLTGMAAGLEQAQDDFGGYGQGAQGYGKRYGANYADLVTSTFIGSALLPSLLKQDPRYFYKGTGGVRARTFYAIANAVICKGDNKKWQANYSNIIGSFAAGGISNLYYPEQSRGAELTFENALIGIGETAVGNLLQEFVIRKLTPAPKVPAETTANP